MCRKVPADSPRQCQEMTIWQGREIYLLSLLADVVHEISGAVESDEVGENFTGSLRNYFTKVLTVL